MLHYKIENDGRLTKIKREPSSDYLGFFASNMATLDSEIIIIINDKRIFFASIA